MAAMISSRDAARRGELPVIKSSEYSVPPTSALEIPLMTASPYVFRAPQT